MRRTESIVILAVVALSLLGCRADTAPKPPESSDTNRSIPETAPPTPAPKATQAMDKRPVVVCFGDSLTAGYGTDLGQSYPDYLQKDLDAEGYNYRVVNEGISGNTTKDGVNRLNSILALKPAVVVVEFGGNDGLRGLRIAHQHGQDCRHVEGKWNEGSACWNYASPGLRARLHQAVQ